MTISWGVLMPVGVASAAVLKMTDLGSSGGKWFKAHQYILYLGVITSITGFIVIFVAKKSWVSHDSQPHAILGPVSKVNLLAHNVRSSTGLKGLITTFLSMANPIMAQFRPGGDDPKRKWFNLFHHSFGYVGLVLALATITLGITQLYALPGNLMNVIYSRVDL